MKILVHVLLLILFLTLAGCDTMECSECIPECTDVTCEPEVEQASP